MNEVQNAIKYLEKSKVLKWQINNISDDFSYDEMISRKVIGSIAFLTPIPLSFFAFFYTNEPFFFIALFFSFFVCYLNFNIMTDAYEKTKLKRFKIFRWAFFIPVFILQKNTMFYDNKELNSFFVNFNPKKNGEIKNIINKINTNEKAKIKQELECLDTKINEMVIAITKSQSLIKEMNHTYQEYKSDDVYECKAKTIAAAKLIENVSHFLKRKPTFNSNLKNNKNGITKKNRDSHFQIQINELKRKADHFGAINTNSETVKNLIEKGITLKKECKILDVKEDRDLSLVNFLKLQEVSKLKLISIIIPFFTTSPLFLFLTLNNQYDFDILNTNSSLLFSLLIFLIYIFGFFVVLKKTTDYLIKKDYNQNYLDDELFNFVICYTPLFGFFFSWLYIKGFNTPHAEYENLSDYELNEMKKNTENYKLSTLKNESDYKEWINRVVNDFEALFFLYSHENYSYFSELKDDINHELKSLFSDDEYCQFLIENKNQRNENFILND